MRVTIPLLLISLPSCATAPASPALIEEAQSLAHGNSVRIQSHLLDDGWHAGKATRIVRPHECMGIRVMRDGSSVILELAAVDRLEVAGEAVDSDIEWIPVQVEDAIAATGGPCGSGG